jgi:tripartite-type tricarboxylate transporter receptor subunit TctC
LSIPIRALRRFAVLIALLCTLPALAQDYPSRPVRLLVPNAPGSSIDTLARILSSRLAEVLGQSIVVENHAGAGGTLGMEMGKSAPPDGYTLILASASSMASAPLLQKDIRYSPMNDFAFVSRFAVLPNVLVVNPALPVKSVNELIAYARANPGKVNFASAGPGAASHLAGVLLTTLGGFESLHVPYKGGSPAVASTMAGETHWYVTPAPNAMSLVKGGRLRALAHSLPKRTPLLPDMPAIAETVPGYDYSGWAGLIAPRGTPAPVIDKVRAALVKTLALPAVREAFAAQGAEIVTDTPEAFRAFLQKDIANTAKVVKAAGLKPE